MGPSEGIRRSCRKMMGPYENIGSILLKITMGPLVTISHLYLMGPCGLSRDHRSNCTWVLMATTANICYMGSAVTRLWPIRSSRTHWSYQADDICACKSMQEFLALTFKHRYWLVLILPTYVTLRLPLHPCAVMQSNHYKGFFNSLKHSNLPSYLSVLIWLIWVSLPLDQMVVCSMQVKLNDTMIWMTPIPFNPRLNPRWVNTPLLVHALKST